MDLALWLQIRSTQILCNGYGRSKYKCLKTKLQALGGGNHTLNTEARWISSMTKTVDGRGMRQERVQTKEALEGAATSIGAKLKLWCSATVGAVVVV
jgi:hypothetical protein